MRHNCYYPLRDKIKHGDVKIIYFVHVGKTTKKSDWFANERPE